MTDSKPILVLINPHSGRGKSNIIYQKKLIPFFEGSGIQHEAFITNSEFRVKDFIHNLSLTDLFKFKSILVVSGDGLLYETVNALMSRNDSEKAINMPIGIIPTGSGNGLAYTLIRQKHPDLDDSDEAIRVCLEQAIGDSIIKSDLVKLTYGNQQSNRSTIWSFLSIGWGLLADIDIDSEWLRRLGEFRFTFYGVLRSVTARSRRGQLSYKPISDGTGTETDDWVHLEDKFACLYAVHQSHVSRVTKFAPGSKLTDQIIYLTFIRGKLSICRAVEFMLAIKDGSHEKLSYVTVLPVTKFTFQPLEQSKVVVDGEVIPWKIDDGPILAEIVPELLNLSWQQVPRD